MNFKKTPLAAIIIITVLCITIISCATIFLPTKDTVKIECNVPGVSIYLDGAYAGKTPLTLEMSRRAGHVLRVEAEGYLTQEVALERTLNAWGVADIVTAGTTTAGILGILAYDYEYLYYAGIPGAILLTISLTDFISGKTFDYPETVQIVLQ